jgi:hypothetical protein
MEPRKRFTVDFTAEELAEWRRLAASVGLLITTSQAAGKGNVAELLKQVGAGRIGIAVWPKERHDNGKAAG